MLSLPLFICLAACTVAAERARLASLEASRSDTDGVRNALALTPGDATLHERLALEESKSAATDADAREALSHAVKALELRPVSPYAWAALAEAKYRLDVADEIFELALRRAFELGPNEPAVQETVAFYGLALREKLAPQTQAVVDQAVAAGMKREPVAMMRIAERRGRLDRACSDAQLCKLREEK